MGGLLSVPTTTSPTTTTPVRLSTQPNVQQTSPIIIQQTTQSNQTPVTLPAPEQAPEQAPEPAPEPAPRPSPTPEPSQAPTTTQPSIATITNEQAMYIKSKQESILQAFPTLISQLGTLSLNSQQNTTTSNFVERFVGDVEDYIQTPIRLPASATPELDDYISFYNKSVSLLDDPNRFTQANFDAYIHMQEMKLRDLQSEIASFPSNPSIRNKQIKSIKNLKTSAVLNVETYPDPSTQTSLPTSYVGNGAVNYPNYVIYGNNGCMQYTPQSSNNNTAATWSFQPCNSNLPGQRFNMQQIYNLNDYNSRITSQTNNSYKISDPNTTVFGFYVVNPEGYRDQCLQLNQDGLSVMPCNMEASQRFKPYYHNMN
jgi:hypothetical protein